MPGCYNRDYVNKIRYTKNQWLDLTKTFPVTFEKDPFLYKQYKLKYYTGNGIMDRKIEIEDGVYLAKCASTISGWLEIKASSNFIKLPIEFNKNAENYILIIKRDALGDFRDKIQYQGW